MEDHIKDEDAMVMNKYAARLKESLRHSWYGVRLRDFAKYILTRDIFCRKMKITNRGSICISKSVIGRNNTMSVGKGACLDRVTVKIQGSNNQIIIGDDTIIGRGCCLYVFGNNCSLKIGNKCSFSHDDELLCQEDNAQIIIGNDCMFSHHINIRTSDAHAVYDSVTTNRVNKAKNIRIGNHVWVTAYCIIQKGANVGDGCIVGTCSIVNHRIGISEIPCNAVIAGQPAKVVKENVQWDRRLEDTD